MNTKLYRQGNVLFKAVAEAPNGRIERTNKIAVADLAAAEVYAVGEHCFLTVSAAGGISIGYRLQAEA